MRRLSIPIGCTATGGFTLLEIIVVLVLVALASSLVYLGVARSMGSHQEKVFGRELVSLTKRARRMAVERGAPSSLLISSGQRRCWVRGETSSVEVPETMLIEGEDVEQVEEGVYGITFYPDGSSSGGKLSFSVGGQVVYAFRADPVTGIISVSKTQS
jgi:general secretion pathway protein H